MNNIIRLEELFVGPYEMQSAKLTNNSRSVTWKVRETKNIKSLHKTLEPFLPSTLSTNCQ